jgi:hypothetical protein
VDTKINKLIQLPIAYLVFLLTFDPPRIIDDYPVLPSFLPFKNWEAYLQKNPLQVTEELIKLGAIIRSDLSTHMEYFFTKDKLQLMLKEKKLAVSGNKADLVHRLIKSNQNEMWSKIADRSLLECTPLAWQTATTYLESAARNSDRIITDPKDSLRDVKKVIRWILLAAGSGVIGNRVDSALEASINKKLQQNSDEITKLAPYNFTSHKPDKSISLFTYPKHNEISLPLFEDPIVVIRHNRERTGQIFVDVLENLTQLDNSNGTTPLQPNFNFFRTYKRVIDIILDAKGLSEGRVKNWIIDFYDLPKENFDLREEKSSFMVKLNIPPGKKSKLIYITTELWVEGNIFEVVDKKEVEVGNYKVFLGYVQPCDAYQLNYS